VAKRCEFAAEVMCANAGFHADQARRNVREPCFHLATRPLLAQHDRTALIETHNVERVLADIDADHGNRSVELLRHGVLLIFGAPCQLRLLAGLEHGRTIPLADMSRVEIPQCSGCCRTKMAYQPRTVGDKVMILPTCDDIPTDRALSPRSIIEDSIGKPQRELWRVGDDGKHEQQDKKKWKDATDHRAHRCDRNR
jgi:hypothetical protein